MVNAETEFRFAGLKVTLADGTVDNGKFFLGALPEPGDVVEMVFVDEKDGALRFQLRTKSSFIGASPSPYGDPHSSE